MSVTNQSCQSQVQTCPLQEQVLVLQLELRGEFPTQQKQKDNQKPQTKSKSKTQLIKKLSNPQQTQTSSELQPSPKSTIDYYSNFFSSLPIEDSKIHYKQLNIQYGQALKKNNVWLTEVKSTPFAVHYKSTHSKVIILIVQIAHFSVQVEVYQDTENWFDEVVEAHGQVLGNGSEGRVIKLDKMGCVMKQYHFENLKHFLFSYTIIEYAITKVASCFQIGPVLPRPFMFDIYCTKKHMYFFLEECYRPAEFFRLAKMESQRKALSEILQLQLKRALHLLHSLQIVHFDIKPENIMFSPRHDKYVLIDYGMAQSKNFLHGHMEPEQFRGTFYYASDKMRELFLQRKYAYVDVYYNDCVCLSKSLEVICATSCNQDNSWSPQSHLFNSQDSRQSSLGISLNVKAILKDGLDERFVPDQTSREATQFYPFKTKNPKGDNESFMANSLVIYVTYLLYHRIYTAIQKIMLKTESLFHQNMEAILQAFFQIGMHCYESEVFFKFVSHFEYEDFRSYAQIYSENQVENQQSLEPNISKQPYDEHTCKMLKKNPSMANFYRAFRKKNQKNTHVITNFYLQDVQKIKLSDLRATQLNSKSIFFRRQSSINEDQKKDRRFHTYCMIQMYVRTMYNKLCLEEIDLNKQSRMVSVFQAFHEILSDLSQLDKSYLPYYQRLIGQNNLQRKFKVMKESLDLVVAHMTNQQATDYIRTVQNEKITSQSSSILSEVCRIFGRGELVQGIQQAAENRKIQHFYQKLEKLLELVRNLSQAQIVNKISETITKCMDLTKFIAMMHDHLTGRCIIVLQTTAQVEGLAKARAQINKNRAYFCQYRMFYEELKRLVAQCQRNSKALSKPLLSTLFTEGLPSILQSDCHKESEKAYMAFEQIIEGRYFNNWSVSTLDQAIDQFRKDVYNLMQNHGTRCHLMDEFVLSVLNQFLFEIRYKCYVDNQFLFVAIGLLEKHIFDNAELFNVGLFDKSFRYPLSVYYIDLFRLYVRVGLRHKASQTLQLLRKVHQKQTQQQLHKFHYTPMLDQDDESIISNSENYYSNLEAKKVNRNQPKTYQVPLKKQSIKKILKNFPITSLQSILIENEIKLRFNQPHIIDILLINDKGKILGKSILISLVEQKKTQKMIQFLSIIAAELQTRQWGGIKTLAKFQKIYIETVFQQVLSEPYIFDDSKQNSSTKPFKAKNNQYYDLLSRELTAKNILRQIQLNLMKKDKKKFPTLSQSQNSSQSHSEVQSRDSNQGAFLLAWCAASSLAELVLRRSDSGKTKTFPAFSFSYIYSLLSLLRKCIVWLYFSKLFQEVQIQSKPCPHKSSNSDFRQKYINAQCTICLQILINSYQKEDYILRPTDLSIHSIFRIYMGLVYGKDYYLKLGLLWEVLRHAFIYEKQLYAEKPSQFTHTAKFRSLQLSKIGRKIRRIDVLQVRNRYRVLSASDEIDCNRVQQKIRGNFMRQVGQEIGRNTKQEVCRRLKQKLQDLRFNIEGTEGR